MCKHSIISAGQYQPTSDELTEFADEKDEKIWIESN